VRMNCIESSYSCLLQRITTLLLPEGPLHELPGIALKLDAIDLKLRSWKHEFDAVNILHSKQQLQDASENRLEHVAEVFATVDPFLKLIEDCVDRA
jgi:hypothetical protein